MLNISVIIPVYNASAFLRKAVESALQFEEVKEILLIEDCSTDDSLEICQRLTSEHARIQLFQHSDKGNHGAGATRNLGLEKASQEFIAFLDADDYYLSNRFDSEKKLFKNEKIEGVFGAAGTEFLTKKGKKEFQDKFKSTTLTTVKRQTTGKEVFYGLLGLNKDFGTFFPLISLTVRTESIRKNYLEFNEKLRIHQDSDFIIRLSYHCNLKSGSIDQAVSMRGVHDDNRITKIKLYSQNYNENQFLFWDSIEKWSIGKDIIKQYLQHIQLNKTAFELATEKGILKYTKILKAIFTNLKILKTRYRFIFLNR